jgi:hypothetical protein
VRYCSVTRAGLLTTSRFEDYSRCDGLWVERLDGMMSVKIRLVCRTSIALL